MFLAVFLLSPRTDCKPVAKNPFNAAPLMPRASVVPRWPCEHHRSVLCGQNCYPVAAVSAVVGALDQLSV